MIRLFNRQTPMPDKIWLPLCQSCKLTTVDTP